LYHAKVPYVGGLAVYVVAVEREEDKRVFKLSHPRGLKGVLKNRVERVLGTVQTDAHVPHFIQPLRHAFKRRRGTHPVGHHPPLGFYRMLTMI
jgi:hypothetical protein